jgi:hypothetical protein
MLGSRQEQTVAFATGRVGILAALVALAIALAVAPSVLAVALMVGGPFPETHADWLGQILRSLNVLRLGAAAGLLLALPLVRGER